jgi:hypothetical protein
LFWYGVDLFADVAVVTSVGALTFTACLPICPFVGSDVGRFVGLVGAIGLLFDRADLVFADLGLRAFLGMAEG